MGDNMDAALAAVLMAAINMVGSVMLALIRAHYSVTEIPNGHSVSNGAKHNDEQRPPELRHG